MIQYSLKCSEGHRFDSWFQSASAYDKLKAHGMVTCTQCGTAEVEKAIMAPRVQSSRKSAAAAEEGAARKAQAQAASEAQTTAENLAENPATPGVPGNAAETATRPARPKLSEPATEQERALAALRKEVEANSEYVGESFADEARAMHLGEAPERAIHGEAKLDEAKQLIDDGVPVVPLPFRPGRKSS